MFNPLTALIVADVVGSGLLPPDPTVVDLGNQTYGVDRSTLKRILDRLRDARVADRRPADLETLRSFLDADGRTKPAPLVEHFYRALGFAGYEAIDINSRYGSHVMDLNQDVDKEYGFSNTYDFVVNTGTSEHVFNQAAFFRNAHNLAKPGGLMLHILPFTGYANHGFYNYQPNIFFDLAAVNGYSIMRFCLADRNDVLMDLIEPNDNAAYFLHHLGLATRNEKNNTFLVTLLRRNTAAPFCFPCQGKYVAALEGGSLVSYYGRQAPDTASARKMFRPADPVRTGSRIFRLKRKLKKNILRFLRNASRFVLLRLWPTI